MAYTVGSGTNGTIKFFSPVKSPGYNAVAGQLWEHKVTSTHLIDSRDTSRLRALLAVACRSPK